MAIQICVSTALREVPRKLLIRRFCLIHLKGLQAVVWVVAGLVAGLRV